MFCAILFHYAHKVIFFARLVQSKKSLITHSSFSSIEGTFSPGKLTLGELDIGLNDKQLHGHITWVLFCYFNLHQEIQVGTHEGTCPCNKSQGQVPSCELVNFASKSSRLWSLRLVPRIQTSLNFWNKSLRLVPQNASCELFVGPVPVTSLLV